MMYFSLNAGGRCCSGYLAAIPLTASKAILLAAGVIGMKCKPATLGSDSKRESISVLYCRQYFARGDSDGRPSTAGDAGDAAALWKSLRSFLPDALPEQLDSASQKARFPERQSMILC